jgi:hypothetical protein
VACHAKDIRRTLQTLLGPRLGDYTLANGAVTPAIAVRAWSERLPTGTRAKGLEVVVIRYPEETPVRQYVDEPLDDIWTVWLVGWDNTADLQGATKEILRAYPGTNFQQITVPKSWGPTNQVKVELRNPWVTPEEYEVKEIDGGWFHPYLVIPATEVQATLDSGDFSDGSSQDEWPELVDGGVFA